MLRVGMGGGGFRNGVSDARLKGQLSFSSRQGSVMSQISEVGSEELDGGGGSGSPEAAGSNASGAARGYSGIPGYPMGGLASGAWPDEASPSPTSGAKRPRDSGPALQQPLAPQLSLPSGKNKGGRAASAEMAAIEKFLQFQDAVPCKIRAKRGCATHPRSIAERVRCIPARCYSRIPRLVLIPSPIQKENESKKKKKKKNETVSCRCRCQVRRTKISERIRKLQELVPNMEKVTKTQERSIDEQ
jgi:hypothetical protein